MNVMDRVSKVKITRKQPIVGNPTATPRRRRPRPRPGVAGAALALLAAVFVWAGVALLVARGDLSSGLPGGLRAFMALTAGSCFLDLGAAWLVVQDRARRPMLGYLAARTLLAACGLVFFALPIYALGAAALFASPRPQGTTRQPHAFVPADSTSASAITLNAGLFARDWSQMSQPTDAGPRCASCGEPPGALIHRVDDAD